MTLQEVLRGGRQCDEDGVEIIMSRQACVEAAAALDAKDARIKELEGALRDTLECFDGCMVFITSREKINSEYGPGWIADMTNRAREALK